MPKVSEVYNKLYHYTTWEGLQGILENQTLWATNYKFLNDYSEIVLFKDKLISLVYPYAKEAFQKLISQSPDNARKINDKGGLQKVVQHDSAVTVDAQYSALGDEIYILSFCGQHPDTRVNNNGLLSQWRGYGSGGGAALVFDTRKLEEILELEAIRFEYSIVLLADLIYSDDEQKLKEELSADLSIIGDIVKQMFDPANLKSRKQIDASKAYFPFVRCISRYKHCGFSEENEVRVVALPTVIDKEVEEQAKSHSVTLRPAKKIRFRQRSGERVPYIELFDSNDIVLPIEKIIIGPHVDKEARAKILKAKLIKKGIQIACSDIPYVCR